MAAIYCAYTDVQAQSKPINDLASHGWAQTQIDLRIIEAQNLIDSILNPTYTIPFAAASIPPLIKTICINLSVAFVLRDIYMKETETESKTATELERQAMEQLEDIASCKKILVDSSGVAIAIKDRIKSFTYDNGLQRHFGMGEYGEYVEEDKR